MWLGWVGLGWVGLGWSWLELELELELRVGVVGLGWVGWVGWDLPASHQHTLLTSVNSIHRREFLARAKVCSLLHRALSESSHVAESA